MKINKANVRYLSILLLVVSPLSFALGIFIECPKLFDIHGAFANESRYEFEGHKWVLKAMDENDKPYPPNPTINIDPNNVASYVALNTFMPATMACDAHVRLWQTGTTPPPFGPTARTLRVMIGGAEMIPRGYECKAAGIGYNCTPKAS